VPLNRSTHLFRGITVAIAVVVCLLAGGVGGLSIAPASAAPAFDPSGLETQLVSLMQQDRFQQGMSGLVVNGTLAAYARGASFQPCPGVTAHGRAEDMVERNYFAHAIPPCGAPVWSALQSSGLPFQAAGENIAWSQGSGVNSPGVVNSQFMASPGHRANILGDYNAVGVGAWPAATPWTGAGGPRDNVILYAVIFARLPGMVGPAPPRVAALPPPPAEAPAPPPPVAAPPPPPAPAPSAQVLNDSHVERHITIGPLIIARSTSAAIGPAFLEGFAILLLLVLGPPIGIAAAGRRRRPPPS
jgi:uncharacterized protein YkwD